MVRHAWAKLAAADSKEVSDSSGKSGYDTTVRDIHVPTNRGYKHVYCTPKAYLEMLIHTCAHAYLQTDRWPINLPDPPSLHFVATKP